MLFVSRMDKSGRFFVSCSTRDRPGYRRSRPLVPFLPSISWNIERWAAGWAWNPCK